MTISSFDTARLLALKEYAALEHELCKLLRNLLNVSDSVASAIFYQITNTRARYAIIDSLIELNCDGRWKSWSKIAKWLMPRDGARNSIVHWFEDELIVIGVGRDEDGKLTGAESVECRPRLKNASRRGRFSETETYYSENELYLERDQVRVMKHIVNRLQLTICEPEKWPWRDIFLQPPADHTPEEFLSSLNGKGHPALLPPYPR